MHMIRMTFQRLGVLLLGIFIATGLQSQATIPEEDDRNEQHQKFLRTSGSRPNVVITENEPRLELLRTGFDLEEVAAYTSKRAREEMRNVDLARRFIAEMEQNQNRQFPVTLSSSNTGSYGISDVEFEITGTTISIAPPPEGWGEDIDPNSGTTESLPAGLSINNSGIISGESLSAGSTATPSYQIAETIGESVSQEQFEKIIQLIAPPEERSDLIDQFERFAPSTSQPTPPVVTPPDIPPSEPNIPSTSPGLPGFPFGFPFVPDESLDIFADASQLINHLLTDATVGSGMPDPNRIFTRARLVANSFNYSVVEEIAAHSGHEAIAQNIIDALQGDKLNEGNAYSAKLSDVFSGTLNTDLLGARQFRNVGDLFGLTTEDFTLFTAKDLTFERNSVVDVSKRQGANGSSWPRTRIVAFGAADDVLIEGDVTFTNHGHEPMDQALAVGGAGNLIIENANVEYDGSNFGLGAGNTVVILKSSIETKDHLGIGSLGDIWIEDSKLTAGKGNRTFIYANKSLSVNGLEFSEGLRQVYMEATTVNLTDVDFPAGSEVRLISQLGGIDGKYPNFGSSGTGSVNFVVKVSYGGTDNMMMDRASFDQFGQNISIESFR